MSEKCRDNNSYNPLTSRRTDGGKKAEMPRTSQFVPVMNIMGW